MLELDDELLELLELLDEELLELEDELDEDELDELDELEELDELDELELDELVELLEDEVLEPPVDPSQLLSLVKLNTTRPDASATMSISRVGSNPSPVRDEKRTRPPPRVASIVARRTPSTRRPYRPGGTLRSLTRSRTRPSSRTRTFRSARPGNPPQLKRSDSSLKTSEASAVPRKPSASARLTTRAVAVVCIRFMARSCRATQRMPTSSEGGCAARAASFRLGPTRFPDRMYRPQVPPGMTRAFLLDPRPDGAVNARAVLGAIRASPEARSPPTRQTALRRSPGGPAGSGVRVQACDR